ncbi:helix-turn-helix domain-containing protein [Clostridium sp. BNL1100]|uniref:helix-turn-helix domain-containing protein n=1 Tax=Clostridium sp. BNL1100 TaxID=755731 RepID=UPI00024A7B08|nr:helix-turn-helix domain-containing protein [Clostridium sp. BNL1100]AEY67957.1 transposase [Clostridium sp. BNL1100]
MKRIRKFTSDEKLRCVFRCIEGKEPVRHVANLIGVNHITLKEWIRNYKVLGIAALSTTHKRPIYSDELKESAVKDYLNGIGSQESLCLKYSILAKSTLRNWILKYNSHMEDSIAGGTSLMTDAHEVTYYEKFEIVRYCIEHQKNYSETAQKFNVSYHQVYSWTHKYESGGIDALQDNRGKKKNKGEWSELEKLRAENRRQKMEIDFLKKLDEIERRRF